MHWVTVAVKSLTTDTVKYTCPHDIRHAETVEYVKLSHLIVNVGHFGKASINPFHTKLIVFLWVRKLGQLCRATAKLVSFHVGPVVQYIVVTLFQ